MDLFININGEVKTNNERVLLAGNHSYRYADGLFETIKVENGKIKLVQYHFERLFNSIKILKFEPPVLFTREKICEEIIQLCRKNICEKLGRVRLSVSRGNAGIYDCDDKFQYLIECWPLEESVNMFNEAGLIIDIFPDARKSIDKFSNLKSANYLPYVMAAVWAKENKLSDALLLNTNERICEATMANVFWVKGGTLFTPPLNEGCIAGVIREYLIDHATELEIEIMEKELYFSELETADEIFLTNAISGIRPVKKFRNKNYQCNISKKIFNKLIRIY